MKNKLYSDTQRLWDLVRYSRMRLHNDGLVSDEEYADLAADHAAVARLETYDELRAKVVRSLTAAGYKAEFEAAYKRGDGPVHTFFELSYAQYLTIPRSVLQSMPLEWQTRFVACLQQLDNTFDWRPDANARYRCDLYETVEDSEDGWKWGRKLFDKLAEYRHQIFDSKKVR